MKNKHFLVVVVAFFIGLACWAIIEFLDLTSKTLVGGFLALLIGLTFELLGELLIQRTEMEEKVDAIKTSLDQAGEQLAETKSEAKGVQVHVSSLEQGIMSLEQGIRQGLLAKELDDPANVWQQVLEDACKSKRSIFVAITVPNFSAPRKWDEQLSQYLRKRKEETNEEVLYIVAIYRPRSEWSPEAVKELLEINEIYRSKDLQSVTHGFVDQSQYFQFNVVAIDRKSVGFLWDSMGGKMSTKGIYFREAPKLSGEMTDWFENTCRLRIRSVREITTAPPIQSHDYKQEV